jgi:N-acetylmuramoyl-L-alanine amidase
MVIILGTVGCMGAQGRDSSIVVNNTDIKKAESIRDISTPVVTAVIENAQTEEAVKLTEVSQVPVVKSKTIVIDPGHAYRSNKEKEALAPGSKEVKIKDGGGAAGVYTRTPEYEINMKVALKLKDLLEQKGFKVLMTKSDNSVSLGNIDRANIGNEANADLVIRIHCDSNSKGSVQGASMLIPANSGSTTEIYEESKRCGEIVLDNLIKEVGMKNRGVIHRTDLTGFNWSKVPVILVEMGFLSNVDEDKLLSSDSYQQKLAAAMGKGIAEALKQEVYHEAIWQQH